MGRDGDAVDAFPPEGVVGEGIAAVVGPGDLLGGKADHAAALEDLRQRAGVAKHIRQPEHPAVDVQFFLEELPPVHHLADQALAAG